MKYLFHSMQALVTVAIHLWCQMLMNQDMIPMLQERHLCALFSMVPLWPTPAFLDTLAVDPSFARSMDSGAKHQLVLLGVFILPFIVYKDSVNPEDALVLPYSAESNQNSNFYLPVKKYPFISQSENNVINILKYFHLNSQQCGFNMAATTENWVWYREWTTTHRCQWGWWRWRYVCPSIQIWFILHRNENETKISEWGLLRNGKTSLVAQPLETKWG